MSLRPNLLVNGCRFTLFIAIITLAACGQESHLLREKQQALFANAARFDGVVRNVHGCLVIGGDAEPWTIVWPSDVRLSRKGHDAWVVTSERLNSRLTIGEPVTLGGGEVPPPSEEEFHRLWTGADPRRCPAPYWVVGRFGPRRPP